MAINHRRRHSPLHGHRLLHNLNQSAMSAFKLFTPATVKTKGKRSTRGRDPQPQKKTRQHDPSGRHHSDDSSIDGSIDGPWRVIVC